jgi:hypothetical protein
MEILGKILGSPSRVKIMRLFLFNRDKSFAAKDVSTRSRVAPVVARREIRILSSVGFLKKRGESWIFNTQFPYGSEFEDLLLGPDILGREAIIENFKKAGRMKLLIVSGLFIKNRDSRVDLMIVGDKLKRGKIEEGVKKMEAEVGAELSYAIFETKEFLYRLNMYDKLIRDILDYPHEVIVQAKELSTQTLKKL